MFPSNTRRNGGSRISSKAISSHSWRKNGTTLPQTTYTYDQESGVVFSEYKVNVSKRQAHDWIGEPRSRAQPKDGPHINDEGSASLQDMTVRCVARNIQNVTADHLYGLPWPIANRIWLEILRSRRESFHAWRTFASVYPIQFASPEFRYQITIRDSALPMADYYAGLDSSPAKWMTCLRISPRYTPTADMVNLAAIRNLAVLDLSDDFTIDTPSSFFDERIMKSWVELIQSRKAFRHLRVLMFGWQEFVATWIFEYLKHFPSLCSIIFTDCPKLHQRNKGDWEAEARSLGWIARSAKRSAKDLRPIVGERNFHKGAISGTYYETQPRFAELVHDLKPFGMEDCLPIVECWIGRPRLWTHVVDEFPRTRTIWFDNMNTNDSAGRITGDRIDKAEKGIVAVSNQESKKSNTKRPGKAEGAKTLEDLLREVSKRSKAS